MIKILEVNNIDLPGKRFNGFDFIENPLLKDFDIKQYVVIKQSNNDSVLKDTNIDNLYNKLQDYEEINSIHNLFSVTSNNIRNLPGYDEIDIIHFHMFHNTKLSIPSLVEFAKEKKVIITLHDPWFLTGRCVHFYKCNKWQNGCKNCEYLDTLFPFKEDNCNLMWKIKKETFARLNIDIVVTSKWMYSLLEKSPIFKNQKNIHYIPFGIDTDKFKPMSMDKARKKLNIPMQDKVLFFRAQNEFKGTEYIVAALKNMEEENITLLTCDNVGLLKEIKDKYNIVELGMANDDVLLDAYNACDIFLMPSKGESFGMMAIEAMACEKPVVVFDNSALPTVTHAPECGILVKNGDADDLRRTIENLLSNKDERLRRGTLGRKICLEEYTNDMYLTKIAELYQNVKDKDYYFYDNQPDINFSLANNIIENIETFLTRSTILPLDKKQLENLTIEDFNYINGKIYNKYIVNKNSKIRLSHKQRIKSILKKNKLVRIIYNKLKRR